MTGAQLKELFEVENDLYFSGYWSDTKLNSEFKKAFITVLNSTYTKRLDTQKSVDEMSNLIAIDVAATVNPLTNTVYFGATAGYITLITYAGTTVTVNTTYPHDLLTDTNVTFFGITALVPGTITNLNGQTYSVTVVSSTQFTFTASFAPTGTANPNVGNFYCPEYVPDYYHYLYGKATFSKTTDYTVTDSTNTTPIKITLNKRSSFRSGDSVTISGITGNTNANGTHYLKQLNDMYYALYSDEKLLTPVAGNGVHGGTGTVLWVVISPLRYKRSDEKGNTLATPTVFDPYFQQSKIYAKILPLTESCVSVTIDYIRKPPVFIDVANTTLDFTNWYEESFQYEIVEQVGRQFASSQRDGAGLQIDTQQMIEQQ